MIAELLTAVARGDGCICLEGDAGAGRAAVLDRVAAELARSRVRVLRASPPGSGGFGLPELMAQVAGPPRPGAPPGDDPEGAFEALVDPGEGCSRVALLVDGADALLPAAIRYIELALRSAPRLCVVLACPPGFLDASSGEGFTGLRRRVACRLHLPASPDRAPDRPRAPAGKPAPPPAAAGCTNRPDGVCGPMDAAPGPPLARPPLTAGSGAAPAPVAPVRNGRVGLWADLWMLAGVGVAASLLLAAWTADWTETASRAVAVASGRTGTAPAVTGPLAERWPAGVRKPDVTAGTAGGTLAPSGPDAVGVEQAAPTAARAASRGAAFAPASVPAVAPDAPSRASPGGTPMPTMEDATSGTAAGEGAAEAAPGRTAGRRPSEDAGGRTATAERARSAPPAPSATEAVPRARLAVLSGASSVALDAAKKALLPRDRAAPDRRTPSPDTAALVTSARDGERCREITAKITTGQELRDADREFLRRGCQRRG